jgi:hypothetical protein
MEVAVTPDCSTVLTPSQEVSLLVNRPHTPPSVNDQPFSSKRHRHSIASNRFSPLADDDEDVEAQLITATEKVSQLLLVPATPPSENVSGMRL